MSIARHRIAVTAAVLFALPASLAHARAQDGTISRTAGTTQGFAGDGGPATQALMDTPSDVSFLTDGSYVIADLANSRIRRVFPDGHIDTDAGTGDEGFCCDGGKATNANINRPRGVMGMPDGGYLIADTANDAIRRVFPDGHIDTIAGENGSDLQRPSGTAIEPDGTVLIADTGHDRVAALAPNGTLSTIAGSGARGFAGDGGPATAAQLNQPLDLSMGDDGSVFIADTGNNRVRRIAPDGTITTVAGTGAGLSGDGDPAAAAHMNAPSSVTALAHGGFIVADTGNDRVRRVTPMGTIFTVVGTDGGNSGDGGLAKNAQLASPGAISAGPGSTIMIADTANQRIRRISDIGAVPPAIAGHSVAIEPNSGAVAVLPLGQQSLLPLQEEDLIPVRSLIDATQGHINVTVAKDAGGDQLTADVFDAPFQVQQGSDAAPFTNFKVAPLTGCPPTGIARRTAPDGGPVATTAAKKKKKRKKKQSLWVKESGGRWRSSTGGVSGSAVGTFWNTTLFCDGTRVTVKEGIVRVRDKARKRNVLLRAGQSVFIKAPRPLRGQ